MRRKSSHRSIWRLSAKLAYLPSLYLSPQGTISSFDGGKAAKTYSVPVTASWEIDIFGKLRNAKRQSQALYAQSQDYRQAVRTQVIAGIANTYYTLLMLDAQLEISEQTKISWKESADATRALMNAGRADNSAVSQMEAAYYSVCASVLDLKEQINQVENSMSLLLASTPHTIERGKLDTLNIPTSFSTGIPVQLLSNRPDVRAITLSGSAGGTNSAGSTIVNPGKFLASAVGSLPQPLFARGQLTEQLKIASQGPAGRSSAQFPAGTFASRNRGEQRLDTISDGA